MHRNLIKKVISLSIFLLFVIIFSWFIKKYVLTVAIVPSSSMENTLLPDEYIFGINEAFINQLNRGDIILFKNEDNQIYVKRIIGIPEDNIVIDRTGIYINGSKEPIKESYVEQNWIEFQDAYIQSYKLKNYEYFVLGDNRTISEDSRYIGNIKRTDIISVIKWKIGKDKKLIKVN